MRTIVLYALLLCVFISCNAQEKTTQKSKNEILLDSIIQIAKRESLYTKNVQWDLLEQELHQALKPTDSLSALKLPIHKLLRALNDHHGFATINNEQVGANIQKKRNVPYEYNTQAYYSVTSTIFQYFMKHPDAIKSKMLDGNIAYIQIPPISNNNGDEKINLKFTVDIREKLCTLAQHNPKGYIIDLRANLGGNMYPMFNGLGLLFPNALVGGDSKDGKTFHAQWQFKEGVFHYGDYYQEYIPELNCKHIKHDLPIAVLIGRYTTSSGEALASSLKGLPNVKLFGETTSGYSTSNSWMLISENLAFNPAVAVYMSQDKTAHYDGIHPDVYNDAPFNFESPTTGLLIDQVRLWMHSKKQP
jgi:hypothetical protein